MGARRWIDIGAFRFQPAPIRHHGDVLAARPSIGKSTVVPRERVAGLPARLDEERGLGIGAADAFVERRDQVVVLLPGFVV